jgi:hypothetical protein
MSIENENEIIISNQVYTFTERKINQSELKFYPQNPRIYSLLDFDEEIPDQKDIEDKLSAMDHVRELRLSIEANGGLIDPLMVRDGDFVVLEGNSRLAAYRMLKKKDPIKWSMVKCRLLPSNISDDAVFKLLGQYHIIGRKDWSPFEQAGYLYRRIKDSGIKPEALATEMGLSGPKTRKMVEVYEFMKSHNAIDPSNWSYYEEYLKSRSIGKARNEFPVLDETIVNQIKTGEITQAIDIRHKLEPITKVTNHKKRKKLISDLITGISSLDSCFEEAEQTGINTDLLKNLTTVRNKLNNIDESKSITTLSADNLKKCQFEIKKIAQRIRSIEKKFNISP